MENPTGLLHLYNMTEIETTERKILSKMFTDTCTVIGKLLDQAEKDIIEADFDKEKKELIVDLVYNRINRIIFRFETKIFEFNCIFGKKLSCSVESFGHDEILDILLSLTGKAQSIDVDSVD